MTGPALAALLWLAAPAGGQGIEIDCAGTVASLRLSHPNLRCTCASANASPSCSEGSSSGGSAPSRGSGGSRKTGYSMEVQVLKGLQQSMDDMYRNMSGNIGAKAREGAALSRTLDAQQKQQAIESERFLTEAERRRKAADAEKSRSLAGQMIMPATRAKTPRLLRGDPACPGGPGAECRTLKASDVPPLSNAPEAAAARARGDRMQEELDARRGVEDIEAMEARLKKHAADEYVRVGLEKTKDFVEDRAEALSRQISALERVKEQGSIVKDYTTRSIDNFKQKASAAACELARSSARCLASYGEADAREAGDREHVAGSIKDNVGEQFLVPGQEDGAEAKDAAAVGFFGWLCR